MRDTSPSGYTAVAIVLHWAIAAAIVGNFMLGWWMHRAIEAPQTQAQAVAAFQMHKSIGLTILALSVLRLIWRLGHRPPPLPAAMPAWEKLAAKSTHWMFYLLMLGIPLSGWLYVSTQWRASGPLNVPTLWFGLFEVPHLLGLNTAAEPLREWLAGRIVRAHEVLAWSAVGLLVLHVAAALKHQFVNRDEVLGHMIPALHSPPERAPARRDFRGSAILWLGLSATAVAIAAAALTLTRTPGSADVPKAPAAQPTSTATSAAGATITSTQGGWALDPARSEIAFSGTHAGTAFRGRFTRWNADLHIDAQDMTRSRIAASIETASATDGVPLHDRTLPQPEWFDVEQHPVATFQMTGLRLREGSLYDMDGTLTIKNHPVAVSSLTLHLLDDHATISGRVTIGRSSVDMGMESDPDADWVSNEIVVDVRVEASK